MQARDAPGVAPLLQALSVAMKLSIGLVIAFALAAMGVWLIDMRDLGSGLAPCPKQ